MASEVALGRYIGYNENRLISWRDRNRLYRDVPRNGINKVGPMGEQKKECQDCGWRGPADQLDETKDTSTGDTHIFCPDCGGTAIEDLNPDEKAGTSES